MKVLVRLFQGLLLSVGAIALGGLAGLGVASPQARLVIPSLAAGSCIAIAFANPPAVLAVLVLAAPLANFAHLDLRLAEGIPSISLIRLSATFLMILLMLQITSGERVRPRIVAIDLAFLAAVAGIGLSVTRSIELVRSSQVFFDSYLIPFLMYFLAKHMVNDRTWLDRIMVALISVGIYLAALTTLEQTTGQALLAPGGDIAYRYSEHLGRSTVIFGNSAISGAVLAIIFPISVIRFLDSSRPAHKVLLALALGVIATGLFFTYTRAAWLTSLISLFVLQFFYPSLRRFLFPALIIAGLLAIAFWGELSSSALFAERISSQGPIEGRSSLLDLGIRFFQENPVWGIGFDNFRQITRLWNMTEIENTHNSFLFILVSSGLAGLIPYLTAFLLILIGALRGLRWLVPRGESRLLSPLCVAIIAYLGNALVIDVVSAPYLSMVFFITVGCHFGLLERLRSKELAREEGLPWRTATPVRASA